MRRLEIGPRDIPLEKYEHLDIYPGEHIEYVADATHLPFKAESIDEIFACHIIEHIPWYKTVETLEEWYRVIKPGGFVELWTNDFRKLCWVYLTRRKVTAPTDRFLNLNPDDVKQIWANIKIFWYDYLGHQEEWHKAIFDFELLKYCLEKAGFDVIVKLERFENKGQDHGILELGVRAYKAGNKKAILSRRRVEVCRYWAKQCLKRIIGLLHRIRRLLAKVRRTILQRFRLRWRRQ